MSISIQALKEAISIKEEISTLEARLNKILAGGELPFPLTSPSSAKTSRKKMSAAARARIGAAQKARWAKIKGTAPVAKAGKKKGGLSPEGRARIIAAQKKRWAAKKKQG